MQDQKGRHSGSTGEKGAADGKHMLLAEWPDHPRNSGYFGGKCREN